MTAQTLDAELRLVVGRFRLAERRTRRFDPILHVGRLGGDDASVAVPARVHADLDRQLRIELVAALLESAPQDADAVWLTRPGAVEVTADDLAWFAGAQAAFASAGLGSARCYVVTRQGWVDVRSGDRRVWRRLRLDR